MTAATKNFAALATALVLAFSLAGCGSDAQPAQSNSSAGPAVGADDGETRDNAADERGDAQTQNTQSQNAPSGRKILVAYFSRTGEQYEVGVIEKGNTAVVAEIIAEKLGADLWEIVPKDDRYPTKYKELTDAAKKELNEKARPDYAGEAPDLSQYDTVFIGAPVWWGDWPMIMYTFFEKNAEGLSGKKLVPFSTHEGSGLSGFDKKLASACPNSETLEGLAIRGKDAQNKRDAVRKSVDKWLSKLGY